MNDPNVQGLLDLLRLDPPPPSSEDLGVCWAEALESHVGSFPEGLGSSSETTVANEPTFAEVLFGARTAPEDLARARSVAKAARSGPEDLVPKKVATALYYCALAAERLALEGQRPQTRLSDDELVMGLEWLAGREWVDERSRALARRLLARLDRAPTGP